MTGNYWGNFDIDITYDIDNLPHGVKKMGEFGQSFVDMESTFLLGNQFAVTSSTGSGPTCTLFGEATASVNVTSGYSSISLKPTEDVIKGGSITANYYACATYDPYVVVEIDCDVEFTIGRKDNRYVNIHSLKFLYKSTATTPMGVYVTEREMPVGSGDMALDYDIFERSDRAVVSPKLTILPR